MNTCYQTYNDKPSPHPSPIQWFMHVDALCSHKMQQTVSNTAYISTEKILNKRTSSAAHSLLQQNSVTAHVLLYTHKQMFVVVFLCLSVTKPQAAKSGVRRWLLHTLLVIWPTALLPMWGLASFSLLTILNHSKSVSVHARYVLKPAYLLSLPTLSGMASMHISHTLRRVVRISNMLHLTW